MIPNKKFTLLIIDCQNDFVAHDGSMYVNDAENKIANICKFIKENKDNITRVILTKDNHPKNHLSFMKNGGEWPEHCVEGTWGSKINEDIISALNESNIDYVELCKGEVNNFEEYSAATYADFIDDTYVMKTATDAVRVPTDDIVVCGVAGEYCVLHTILDIQKLISDSNIYLYLDGIASIDGGDAITDLITDKTDLQIV